MAVTAFHVLCFAAVMAGFVQPGWSLQCYQCNSHNDSRCLMNPLPEALRSPCPAGHDKMCRKITQTVEVEMSNTLIPDTRIMRTCGWDDSNYLNRCYQRSGYGSRQEVCSCLGDNCNSAGLPAAAATLVAASVVALIRL